MNYLIKLIISLVCMVSFIEQIAVAEAVSLQGLDIERLPEWEMKTTSDEGTLLFSDSPEMVSGDGLLYQDKVLGSVRLFFYHVNASKTAKRFDVILENTTNNTAHITVNTASLGGPGYAWTAVGKETITTYLAGTEGYSISVPAGGAVPLSAQISETAVLPNMLINGIFDFVTDRQVTVKIMMRPLFEDSKLFAGTAKILPADQFHLRGTFKGANRQLVPARTYEPSRDGAVALTLADNDIDPYVKGIDATDGSTVVNYGNYGIVYQIAFPTKSGGKISYYLAPLGGEFAGAIGIKHPDVYWSPLAVPQGRGSFGAGKSGESAFLGTYDGGDSLMFTFSPPGGSNLPVRILVLPQ